MSRELKMTITDAALREIEGMRISTGSASIEEVIKKAIRLYGFINSKRLNGCDKLIVKNSHTGESYEITNFCQD